MLTLAATDTLSGGASVASQLTCTVFGMELTAGPTETYKILYQGQLAASPAAIYTVSASTTAFVKTITVVNNDSSARTAQFFVNIGGTGVTAADAITPSFSIPIGGMAYYEDGVGWTIYDNEGKAQVATATNIVQATVLGSDHAISSTTGTEALSLNGLAAGTYTFQMNVIVQSATGTVGPMLGVNFSGTATLLGMHYRFADATTAVTAEVHSMDNVGILTAGFISGMAHNAFSTAAPNLGTTVGVSTTAANIQCFIEGVIVVTAVGDLELWHSSETATSTTVKAGTVIIAIKAA